MAKNLRCPTFLFIFNSFFKIARIAADAAKNAVTANKTKAIADAKASLTTTLASAADLKKAIRRSCKEKQGRRRARF
jgi:hypothetical protein